MNFSFSEDESFWQKRFAAMKKLAESQVDVGLTSSASGRSRFLMAIHENGCPVMRIPPRPVIGPALNSEKAREEMTAAMGEAIAAALAGDVSGVDEALNRSGEAGVDAIHRYIDAGVPPPNSPITINGGWIFNRVAKKGVPVGGKGFDKPLYDTGQLYNDFDYEITHK